MNDTCGRTVDYLRLSVTDRCDYRCRYCMPEEGSGTRAPEELLSAEELLEIAKAAAELGIRKIRLTGGEPLTREDLPAICRGIRAIPGVEELCLTTNGSRLPDLAAPLRSAGVDRVNISVDSLRPERFAAITRRGRLEEALAGIRAAGDAGFRELKLNTVLIGGFNDDEIGDFVALTREHPWEVRFIELMPMGPCAAWERRCFVPCDAVLEREPALEALPDSGTARRYRLPGARGTVGLIAPLSRCFCRRCSRIRVTADGMLKGCLHGGEEIPLRGLHGGELREAIRRGILQKPPGHHLTHRPSDAGRNMNQIGG